MKMFTLAAFAVILLAAISAQATIMIDVNQVGSGVVFSLSGNVNLSSLGPAIPRSGGTSGSYSYDPINGGGSFVISFQGSSSMTNLYEPLMGNPFPYPAFGPGVGLNQSSGTGNVPFYFNNPEIGSGTGFLVFDSAYVSGSSLAATMSFDNQTLDTMGLRPGFYAWTWGTGVQDSLHLNIAVPEPGSTLTLLGIGLACLGFLRRKLGA